MLTEFSLSRRASPVSNFVLKRRRVVQFGSSETVSKVPPSSASSPVFCFVIYSILCQKVWQVMFCSTGIPRICPYRGKEDGEEDEEGCAPDHCLELKIQGFSNATLIIWSVEYFFREGFSPCVQADIRKFCRKKLFQRMHFSKAIEMSTCPNLCQMHPSASLF